MSMTYANAETEARAHSRSEPAAFVPRYARPSKSKKAVKTWMILRPSAQWFCWAALRP